jgi:diguanylate cyclase (GGDEF)-like protein
VLHERLITLPVRALFHWRLIEHAPNLVSESNTRGEQEQLALETDLARQRAQTISLTKPDFCVNSRLAVLSYLAVEAAHPTFAPAYLTGLYRAYWQQQQDISRYEVLAALLQELGLAWLDPDDSAEKRQLAYQREWQTGDFDDRIPAFQSRDNRVMLGLQNSYNIINFANGVTRSFEQQLEREWRQGCRYQLDLAVVILDCDEFKAYNDNYGHFAGDECLRRLADSLAAQVHRPADVVARLGGEEFVLLLPNTGARDALILAERARQDIADLQLPHAARSSGVVTISCGVASTVPHADQTPLALMEEADKALYQAKANGRNCCVQRTLCPPEFARQAPLT